MQAETPKRMRLFVALQVPGEVKSALEQAQSELREALARSSIRWTPREQLHLTLKFLGSVEAGRSEALAGALRAACQGCAPLRLRAQGLGCFPELRPPRVVWAGVRQRQEELVRLQRLVAAAVEGFTAEEPEERFIGHLTLARIKHLPGPERHILRGRLSERAESFFGEWTAANVDLMRSELSSEGARHTLLASVPLRA